MTKLATFVLSPLGILFALLIVAALLLRRRPRTAESVLSVAVVWVYVWTCPWVVGHVVRWWEGGYPPVDLAGLTPAAVAVTLGGAVSSATPPRRDPDLSGAADRVFMAARLFHAGKVQAILVSGGGVGPKAPPGKQSEAEATIPFLVSLGVPRDAILLESASMNTIDNAKASAGMLRDIGVTRIALVTSAIHMPRALHAFRYVGLDPIPVPTDFQGAEQDRSTLRFLPSADALGQGSATVKEMVGLVYYRVKYRAKKADAEDAE
jgi:uncharacterized SAM-binding protein YcdF (DUF218 family)